MFVDPHCLSVRYRCHQWPISTSLSNKPPKVILSVLALLVFAVIQSFIPESLNQLTDISSKLGDGNDTDVISYYSRHVLVQGVYDAYPVLTVIYAISSVLYRPLHRSILHVLVTFGCMNGVAYVNNYVLLVTASGWRDSTKHLKEDGIVERTGERADNTNRSVGKGNAWTDLLIHAGQKIVALCSNSLVAFPYLVVRLVPAQRRRGLQYVAYTYIVLVWWAAILLRYHSVWHILNEVLFAEVAVWLAPIAFQFCCTKYFGDDGGDEMMQDVLLPLYFKKKREIEHKWRSQMK